MSGSAQSLQRLGLVIAARVPWVWWTPTVALGAVGLAWRPNQAVRQWQLNVQAITGRTPSRVATFRAVWSWAHDTVLSMQLGRLSAAAISARVVFSAADRQLLMRTASGPGAVIALPHMGSWDLAGAWACVHGMSVATVAEQLPPATFALFERTRARLGFSVHGHRTPGLLATLAQESRDGRFVCLLADRDFGRRGVQVSWKTPGGGIEATMPVGPAEVSLRSGAVLLGAACHWRYGRMHVVLSEPIEPPPGEREHQVRLMTQRVCNFFADQIRSHPSDWHMLQPIFPGVRP